jgi:hypothetical protein
MQMEPVLIRFLQIETKAFVFALSSFPSMPLACASMTRDRNRPVTRVAFSNKTKGSDACGTGAADL